MDIVFSEQREKSYKIFQTIVDHIEPFQLTLLGWKRYKPIRQDQMVVWVLTRILHITVEEI